MNIITVSKDNIKQEHIGCAIGNDKANTKRANSKKEWMKNRFEDGLVFKKFDLRGKVFIEYMPAEKAWKPVIAPNYLLINCLWVSGQHQKHGYAKKLLHEAIADAKAQNKSGLVYISSKKNLSFLTPKKFFIKHGFEVVDSALPYFELLVLKLNANSTLPKFTEKAKTGTIENKNGLVIYYSHQCPFTVDYVYEMALAAAELEIPYFTELIENHREAQKKACPFGTFSVYLNGKFLTHRMYSTKGFLKMLSGLNP